jgi:hypothetical protein
MELRIRLRLMKPVLLAALMLAGCGGSPDPVAQLSRDLERFPEYSIIVDDLRIDEGLFPEYFLRLRFLTAAGQRVAGRDSVVYSERQTDWHGVKQHVFARYQNFVGMVVASKDRDGRRTGADQAHPPAYSYVGNPHYGSWGAGGFWQFYGQYAMMQNLMGGWRVNRADYGDYRQSRDRGGPYYGPTQRGRTTFGSRGTLNQKTRPNFYKRYSANRQSFSGRARSRTTTTRSSWGSRSFRGK